LGKYNKLKAVVWDMDGVLLDSEKIHFDSWRAVFKEHSLKFIESSLRELFGMTSIQVIRRIGGKGLPDAFQAQLIEEKDRLFHEWIKDKAVFLPGAREWLTAFQADGIRQALASSSGPGSIDIILDALPARDFFDVMVSGRDLPSNPDPHIFLQAARQLGIPPAGCLVIEDAVVGVSAAKAAGMSCLAVATTNPPSDLRDADLVCASLTEIKQTHIADLFA